MAKSTLASRAKTDNSVVQMPCGLETLFIIDDLPDVAELTARKLRPHIKDVRVLSPEDGLSALKKGKHTGLPDALLVDLRYTDPERREVKHGLDFLSRVNRFGIPAVFHTASINSSDATRLASHGVTPSGKVAFSVTRKGDAPAVIAGHLGLVLRDREGITLQERERAIAGASANLTTTGGELVLLKKEISDISALIERLRKFSAIFLESLADPNWGIDEISSAKRGELSSCLNRLSEITSDEMINGDTENLLHEIVNRLGVVNPADLECYLPSTMYPEYGKLTADASRLFDRIVERRKGINFEKFLRENFEDWLGDIIGSAVYYRGSEDDDLARIPDPDGKISRLFQDIKGLLGKKIVEMAVFYRDDRIIGDEISPRDPVKRALNCGAYYTIRLTIHEAREKEIPPCKYLTKVDFLMHELRKARRLHVDPIQYTDTYDPSDCPTFEFSLKARDFEPAVIAQNQERRDSVKISDEVEFKSLYPRGNLKAFSFQIGEVSAVSIGLDPKALISYCGNLCAIMHDGKLILSAGSSHSEAEAPLYFYLKEVLKIEDPFDLAQDSLRLKREDQNHLSWCDNEMRTLEMLGGDYATNMKGALTGIFSGLGARKFTAERYSSRCRMLAIQVL